MKVRTKLTKKQIKELWKLMDTIMPGDEVIDDETFKMICFDVVEFIENRLTGLNLDYKKRME